MVRMGLKNRTMDVRPAQRVGEGAKSIVTSKPWFTVEGQVVSASSPRPMHCLALGHRKGMGTQKRLINQLLP